MENQSEALDGAGAFHLDDVYLYLLLIPAGLRITGIYYLAALTCKGKAKKLLKNFWESVWNEPIFDVVDVNARMA